MRGDVARRKCLGHGCYDCSALNLYCLSTSCGLRKSIS
jgi:hypothetical protein